VDRARHEPDDALVPVDGWGKRAVVARDPRIFGTVKDLIAPKTCAMNWSDWRG